MLLTLLALAVSAASLRNIDLFRKSHHQLKFSSR